MEEVDFKRRNIMLDLGYIVIDVKVNGEMHYVWPGRVEEKAFEIYNDWIEGSFKKHIKDDQKIEIALRDACSDIVSSWFPNWETWDDAQHPCGGEND